MPEYGPTEINEEVVVSGCKGQGIRQREDDVGAELKMMSEFILGEGAKGVWFEEEGSYTRILRFHGVG